MCIGFWSILPSCSFQNINDQALIQNSKKKLACKRGVVPMLFSIILMILKT